MPNSTFYKNWLSFVEDITKTIFVVFLYIFIIMPKQQLHYTQINCTRIQAGYNQTKPNRMSHDHVLHSHQQNVSTLWDTV